MTLPAAPENEGTETTSTGEFSVGQRVSYTYEDALRGPVRTTGTVTLVETEADVDQNGTIVRMGIVGGDVRVTVAWDNGAGTAVLLGSQLEAA